MALEQLSTCQCGQIEYAHFSVFVLNCSFSVYNAGDNGPLLKYFITHLFLVFFVLSRIIGHYVVTPIHSATLLVARGHLVRLNLELGHFWQEKLGKRDY